MYDAAGNLMDTGERTDGNFQTTTFDAASRQKGTTSRYRRVYGPHTIYTYEDSITENYDGDGHSLKSFNTYDRLSPTTGHSEASKYRIWSSVLNTVLTEAGDTGQQLKTNIFAGGAVIATQAHNAGTNAMVEWTITDPVTGSSPQEEFEPFGQTVDTVEPEDGDPNETLGERPPTSVDEPEWMCGFYENRFWDSPIQCQINALENFQIKVRRESVNRTSVSLNDSPIQKFSILGSALDGLMNYALTSSSKKKNNGDSDQPQWDIGDFKVEVAVGIDTTLIPGPDASTGTDDSVPRVLSLPAPVNSPRPEPLGTDPCEGQKGSLNYDKQYDKPDRDKQTSARGHITYNHISGDTAIGKKSKYRGSGVLPDSAIFAGLTALNQLTFQLGNEFESHGNFVYVYAIPEVVIPRGVLPIEVHLQLFLGTDKSHGFEYTNVNTLVIASDCKTAISSYPGLPSNLNGNQPGGGEPVWVGKVPYYEFYFQ